MIAYSSFPGEPPADSLFGRPGQGVSLQSGQPADDRRRGPLREPGRDRRRQRRRSSPTSPTARATGAAGRSTTPWVEFPSLYTASCRQRGQRDLAAGDGVGSRSDPRPRLTESDGPEWGFHTADVNLALGNLVSDVAAEEAAYQRAHR